LHKHSQYILHMTSGLNGEKKRGIWGDVIQKAYAKYTTKTGKYDGVQEGGYSRRVFYMLTGYYVKYIEDFGEFVKVHDQLTLKNQVVAITLGATMASGGGHCYAIVGSDDKNFHIFEPNNSGEKDNCDMKWPGSTWCDEGYYTIEKQKLLGEDRPKLGHFWKRARICVIPKQDEMKHTNYIPDQLGSGEYFDVSITDTDNNSNISISIYSSMPSDSYKSVAIGWKEVDDVTDGYKVTHIDLGPIIHKLGEFENGKKYRLKVISQDDYAPFKGNLILHQSEKKPGEVTIATVETGKRITLPSSTMEKLKNNQLLLKSLDKTHVEEGAQKIKYTDIHEAEADTYQIKHDNVDKRKDQNCKKCTP